MSTHMYVYIYIYIYIHIHTYTYSPLQMSIKNSFEQIRTPKVIIRDMAE